MSEQTSKQYLAFMLGDEKYAVNVKNVREILELTNITHIPCTYDFMRGVINLRGSVVPVIDMRLKFNMAATEKTINTCIIVIETKIEDDLIIIGALADSVLEVIDLNQSQIEPPPRIGTKIDTNFIMGVGKHEEEFIIILDMQKIFSEKDISESILDVKKDLSEQETSSIPETVGANLK